MTQNALGRQMAVLLGRLVGDEWEISTVEQSLDPLALHTGPSRIGLLVTSKFSSLTKIGLTCYLLPSTHSILSVFVNLCVFACAVLLLVYLAPFPRRPF